MAAGDGRLLPVWSGPVYVMLLDQNLTDLLLSSFLPQRRVITADKGLVEMFVEKFGGIREYWGYQVERVVYVNV